jgi:mannose/fructose/N-acetylgalactosamine-specific phosphotransferase system component IIB
MNYIIRVDDRLIHGQVVEGWIKPLKIESIVICSDVICNDPVERTLFEVSTPKYIKLEFSSIVTTAQKIVSKEYEKVNTLILIASLEDLLRLVLEVKKIMPDYIFNPVNIGGIRFCEGRKQIYKALCLNERDIDLIKELNRQNVILEYYIFPMDPKIVLNNLIESLEKEIQL